MGTVNMPLIQLRVRRAVAGKRGFPVGSINSLFPQPRTLCRNILISFIHQQLWHYQRTQPQRVSFYLLSTLHRRSSRSYDTSSGATVSLRLFRGFSQQPNPTTQATLTEHWTKLILSYARFRKLFTLRIEDAEVGGGDWDEVLRNPRINREFALRIESFLSLWPCRVFREFATVPLAVYYLPDGCEEPCGLRTCQTNPFCPPALATPRRMGRSVTRMGTH